MAQGDYAKYVSPFGSPMGRTRLKKEPARKLRPGISSLAGVVAADPITTQAEIDAYMAESKALPSFPMGKGTSLPVNKYVTSEAGDFAPGEWMAQPGMRNYGMNPGKSVTAYPEKNTKGKRQTGVGSVTSKRPSIYSQQAEQDNINALIKFRDYMMSRQPNKPPELSPVIPLPI